MKKKKRKQGRHLIMRQQSLKSVKKREKDAADIHINCQASVCYRSDLVLDLPVSSRWSSIPLPAPRFDTSLYLFASTGDLNR